MIKSWPIIEWYLPPDAEHWPDFWHLSTQVRDEVRGEGLRCGDTVWIGLVDGKSVGAAWEWVELRPGVVMLLDPNSILSNIRFLTTEHAYQEHLVGLVSLNRLAHHLAWQPEVQSVLKQRTETPPTPLETPEPPRRQASHPGSLRAA